MATIAVTATHDRLPDPSAALGRARDAAVRTVRGWSTDRDGLGRRFTPAAYGLYGFIRRAYASEHPNPFVRTGGFRDRVLSGAGQITTTGQGDGFTATLTINAPPSLDRTAGGMYALEWATFYRPEAADLDARLATALEPALES